MLLLHPSVNNNSAIIIILGFPGGAVVKNLLANAGDTGDASLLPRSEDPLEEEMETHSSILAWEIPWVEERQSIESQRFGHD